MEKPPAAIAHPCQAADIDIGGGSRGGGASACAVGGATGRRGGRDALGASRALPAQRQHGDQHDKKDRGEQALQ